MTVFVTGHSYTSLNFSTQTLIVDAQTAEILADVEKFAVTRDGLPFRNQDFNFWGVTFTPKGDQFYCTLSSQGKHYLVKGDIASQTATVLRENVECPSLSPNGTRIAYKKRLQVADRVSWQLHVLNLVSGRDTALNEERSVDDQLEWLDNERVLYTLPASETSPGASTNIWVTVADGRRAPELFLTNAYSPSVER
jgi:Tol biopolymer transport system component